MDDVDKLLRLFLDGMGLSRIVDDPRLRPLDLVASEEGVPRRWACPGVYRLRVRDPESPYFGSEYVGKSVNVRTRVMGHIWGEAGGWSSNPEIDKRQLEARALSLFPNGISRRELLNCEHHWILLLRPSLNTAPTNFGPRLPLPLRRPVA